jgi:uncharacterized protein (UPF0333 family)
VSIVMMYSSKVGVVYKVFAIFVAAVLTAPIGVGSAVYSSQTVAPMAGALSALAKALHGRIAGDQP